MTRDPGQSEYRISLATHSDCLGRWLTVLRICPGPCSGIESEGLVAGATGCHEWVISLRRGQRTEGVEASSDGIV